METKKYLHNEKPLTTELLYSAEYNIYIQIYASEVLSIPFQRNPLQARCIVSPVILAFFFNKQIVFFNLIGDGNLHLNVTSKEFDQEIFGLIEPFVFEWTSKLRGSVSAEHGIGFTKTKFIHFSKFHGSLNLMKGIKKMMDPKGILNPYKENLFILFVGTNQYIMLSLHVGSKEQRSTKFVHEKVFNRAFIAFIEFSKTLVTLNNQ
uniref:D-2-hydroxyglutarate dehydrogenase, mitochondrial n=1 Tax=Timema monikensis TaxID=170555 RepID=A0A7R9E9U1_9NEOP|nr:unnamed protein product [Timema monikensis]